jgi:hypothetical protein
VIGKENSRDVAPNVYGNHRQTFNVET